MSDVEFDGLTSFDSWIVGQSIGQYRISTPIGTGGMSSVYKGVHPEHGAVVFKFLRPDLKDEDSEDRARFDNEALLLQRIDHPNVVKILETGETSGVPYIVMPFLDGWNLEEVLNAQRALPWEKALYVAYEVARGLSAIHACDIIHRDVKPSNVMIVKGGAIRIVDLGIAKHADFQKITATGHLVATLAYSSPEQILGETIDRRSDLFSLGALLYFMVTGIHPFSGETTASTLYNVLTKQPRHPGELVDTLPQPAADVIMRLLEKEARRRFETAEEVAEVCRSLRATEGYGEATRLDLFLSDAARLASDAFAGKYPFVFVRRDVLDPNNSSPAASFAPLICAPKTPGPADEKYSLGRNDDNEIVIPVKTISRTHCWVIGSGEKGGFFVRDAGSTNGTWVNGERASAAIRLRSGDHLTFGPEPSYVFYAGTDLKELNLTLFNVLMRKDD